MKPILSCLLSLLALPIAACYSTSSETVEMEVMPYLAPCTGAGPMSCMMTKDPQVDTTAGFFYDPIEGFRFEWGSRCLIKVEKTHIKDPPMDGSSIRHVLRGTPNCTPNPEWSFPAAFTRSDSHLSGDTLFIDGYEKPIRLPYAEDRDSLAALSAIDRVSLRVEPGEGTWLNGHSVHNGFVYTTED